MPKITLKAARVNSKMTQNQVASALGVSKYSVINWESGRSEPGVHNAIKLCHLYGIDINDIIFCDKVNQ